MLSDYDAFVARKRRAEVATGHKSPTSTVIHCGRGNGQPGGFLDVGEAARAVDDGVGYFAAMGEADRARMLEAPDAMARRTKLMRSAI